MSVIDVCVVVPVYGSAGTLSVLHSRLTQVMQGLARNYELVFVDDGSIDDSWAEIARLQTSDPGHLVAIRLMRNFGQHNALMAGFRHSQAAVVVTLDDDLQNPPEEIPKLLDALDSSDADLI